MPSPILTTAFSALAGSAAIKTYDILSGRNLVLDTRDKMCLATRSLPSWERYRAENPRRSDIVICLTSIPSRLPHLGATLKSLLYQTRSPARIRLHLPKHSRREEKVYEPPVWLARMRALEIMRCEDFGPATKLIPALFEEAPDQKLLVVDDDKLYPPNMVDDFHGWADAYPDTAIGSSGWVVPADLTDRPVTDWRTLRGAPPARLKATRIRKPAPVDIIQGHSGYLVRPRFFDARRMVADYDTAPPEAFFADDIWISAYCQVPKMVLPARRFCFVSYRRSALYNLTSVERVSKGRGDPERHHNTILIRYLRDRWLAPNMTNLHRPKLPAGNRVG